jgi:two-component system, LytTR family, response regulator
MLRVVIVEDEIHSRETLKNLLQEFCEGVEIVGMAGDVPTAVDVIRKENPDLLFLDVELQSGTGFDVLEQLPDIHFDIVFTTAFEQYAVRAIKLSSIDYLLKPIDIEELRKAVEKARQKRGLTTRKSNSKPLSPTFREPPARRKSASPPAMDWNSLTLPISCIARPMAPTQTLT